MLCLFILAKCFVFIGMNHVRACTTSKPKPSPTQSSGSALSENTETPTLGSLIDLKRV